MPSMQNGYIKIQLSEDKQCLILLTVFLIKVSFTVECHLTVLSQMLLQDLLSSAGLFCKNN